MVGAGGPEEDAKFRQDERLRLPDGRRRPPRLDDPLARDRGRGALSPAPEPSRERWMGRGRVRAPRGRRRPGSPGSSRPRASWPTSSGRSPTPGPAAGPGGTVYLLDPEPRSPSRKSAPVSPGSSAKGPRRARLKDLAPSVHEMRKVKSEAEAALLRRAIAVTADAHREVVRLIRPGHPRVPARRGDPGGVRRRGRHEGRLPLDRRLGAELDRPALQQERPDHPGRRPRRRRHRRRVQGVHRRHHPDLPGRRPVHPPPARGLPARPRRPVRRRRRLQARRQHHRRA